MLVIRGDINKLNLTELAIEYKNQAEAISRKLLALNEETKTMQGEELYRTRKRIYHLQNMQMECMSIYNTLIDYYDK